MTRVYLDTNKWIDLARAHYDEQKPHQDVLQHVRARLAKGDLVFPLSIVHARELTQNSDPEKRRRLWEFAVSLSGCNSIIDRQALLPSLIEEAVYKVFGVELGKEPVKVFSNSGFFGLDFGDLPLTQAFLTTESGWKRFWLDMPDELHKRLFTGLRSRDAEFMERNNSFRYKWRDDSYELRKRCHIGKLFWAMRKHYARAMDKLGKTLSDIENLPMDDRLRLVTEVPPLDVETSLSVQHEQQWDREDTCNDLQDIFHLCMAIPYCDLVVTEKYWIDKIKREGLDKKYGTEVFSDISCLLQL